MASVEAAAAIADLGDKWSSVFSSHPQVTDFLCSLSSMPMVDPVRAEDGFFYERAAIEEYFASSEVSHGDVSVVTSPMLFTPMGTSLQEVTELQLAISQFAIKHQEQGGGSAWELLEWEPHGMQPPSVPRRLGPDGYCPQALHSDLFGDMNKRMSDVFRVLDPIRDLLQEVLDGWTPPKIVVIGDESSGKSTVLEQLAMMPVFPRNKRFCTRLPIEVRLRRDPGSSVAKLLVMDRESRQTESGPRTIPIEQGFGHVQAEMDRLIREHGNDALVLKSKILVLEVKHPSVPSIDLVDLPGLTAIKKGGRSEEVEEIIRMQLESDRSSGDQAMYLVIVPASSRPNCSLAMGFIEQNNLQGRAFGVFTHCDQRGKVTTDELRSLMKGVDSMDGASADDLGFVPLEMGWVGTMLAKPVDASREYAPGYFDLHSYERLYQQKQTEIEFFSGNSADPILKELFAESCAGVPALADKLVRGYMECLDWTWKREAMVKVLCKLEEKEFERNMLGCVQAGDLERLAAQEAERRLQSCPAFKQYLQEVVRQDLVIRLRQALTEKCNVAGEDLRGHLDAIKSSVLSAVRDTLLEGDKAIVSFFPDQLKAALTAEVKVESANANDSFQLVARSVRGFLSEIMTPRKKRDMYKAVREQPPFRLDQYTEYTQAILEACGGKLGHDASQLECALDLLSSDLVSFSSKYMDFGVLGDDGTMQVECDVEKFVGAVAALCISWVPSSKGLLAKIQLGGIPLGAEAREVHERRRNLDEEIQKIQIARDGIRDALSISDEELEALHAAIV